MKLPNLVIAGAPKAATTSLFKWLQAHPSVVTSQAKETYYLMDSGYALFNHESNFAKSGIEGYAELFPEYSAGQVCLEATPDYMYQETALKILSTLPTQPVIVFILRDPVERVLSLIEFAKNSVGSLTTSMTSREFVERVKQGQFTDDQILNSALVHSEYYRWLEPWINACGRSRVEIVFFEELANDPRKVMDRLCKRMEIDSNFYDNFEFRPANQSGQVRSPALLQLRKFIYKLMPSAGSYKVFRYVYQKINRLSTTRKPEEDLALINELYRHFRGPNKKLAKLLGEELPTGWIRR